LPLTARIVGEKTISTQNVPYAGMPESNAVKGQTAFLFAQGVILPVMRRPKKNFIRITFGIK
jgi:hypothetical protein